MDNVNIMANLPSVCGDQYQDYSPGIRQQGWTCCKCSGYNSSNTAKVCTGCTGSEKHTKCNWCTNDSIASDEDTHDAHEGTEAWLLPVLSLWYCCRCGSSPTSVENYSSCLMCAHVRCNLCTLEPSRLQPVSNE